MRHLHKFAATMACAVLVLACRPAAADDKPSISGTWVKKDGDLKFEFSKDAVKMYPHGDKAEFSVGCKYTIDKEGLIKLKLTEIEGKAELKEKAKGVLPIGLEFSFTFKVKNNSAVLAHVKGENVEPLKSHLEGDYEKK